MTNLPSAFSNKFAFSLLKSEQDANPSGNVVLSPLAVALAAGLTLNGSRGQARQDTAAVLGFGPGRSLRGMNESFRALLTGVAECDDVNLCVANAMFGQSSLSLKPNFINKAHEYFDAKVRLLDFADPAALMVMNSYICQRSKGKIPSILSELDKKNALVLLSAACFNGPWHLGFDRLLTQGETFTRLDGSKSDCALMYREGRFSYNSNLKFEAVRLPYGDSGRFWCYVLLPLAQGYCGLQSVIDQLESDDYANFLRGFSPRPGKLFLPRFKIEHACTLDQTLKQLGVAAFDEEKSDLSSLYGGDEKLSISLRHKTVFEIGEYGGKGEDVAPAPAVSGKMRSFFVPFSSFSMRVDRPFYFFVRDEKLGATVIAGFINDPAVKTAK